MFFSTPNPPFKYQVQMYERTTGFMVNSSSIFTREEDLQWYLYLTSNLIKNFRFVVYYQTYVVNSIYNYDYHYGSYEYIPPVVSTPEPASASESEQPTFTNAESQESFNTYEPPPKFVIPDNKLPEYTSAENGNTCVNETSTRVATSGFNFHFDPPTNLNINIDDSTPTTENNLNSDNIEWQVADGYEYQFGGNTNEARDGSFMVYHSNLEENNSEEKSDDNRTVTENVINEILDTIEDNEGNSDISDLDEFIAEQPLATSTPPPVDDDYWNVVEQDNLEDMTLQKYGRGYLLKCEEDHPDFGTKYFPSEENCKAWWQPANEGWFVRRENKNYFLERGVQFIYRNNKRSRRYK